MAETDDFSIAYEENGMELVKELDREVLSKGAWATVMYLYQERSRSGGDWSEPKVRIQRYRKLKGSYRPQTRFNISSERQARKIVDTLTRWYSMDEG